MANNFWSNARVSPKLSYRWVVAGMGGGSHAIPIYSLISFQKPSLEVHVSEYININDVAYKPGMLTWNPIEIVLVDAEIPEGNTTAQVYKMMGTAGYRKREGKPMSAIIKSKGSQALGGQIIFQQIYADNPKKADAQETSTLESWTLVKPFITKVDYGRATYATEEVMTVNLTIRYDDARYQLKK